MSSLPPGTRDRLETAILRHVDGRFERACDLLRRLVRTPSPSGQEGRPGDLGTVVGLLQQEALGHGTEVAVDRLTETSANVLERLGQGPRLFLIEAHTDVVPEGDPSRWFGGDPRSAALGTVEYLGGARVRLTCGSEHQEAAIRDRMDRAWQRRRERTRQVLFGRGAFDNKASGAAAALAMAALAAATRESGVALEGVVVAAYTTDEENRQAGVVALLDWLRRQGLLERARGADGMLEGAFGVALEGSYGWAPVIGHRGVLQGRIRTGGRAAHAATPELGVSATLQMARALLALEEGGPTFREALDSGLQPDLLGPVTLALGTTMVGGGVRQVDLGPQGPRITRAGVNAVPDWCEATFDVRFPPARGAGYEAGAAHVLAAMRAQLTTALDRSLGDWSVEVTRSEPGVSLGATRAEAAAHPLVRAAQTRATQVLGYPPLLETAPGGTDATLMARQGGLTSLVEWGPGGGLSHAANEFVELEGIREGARALALLATDLLGLRAPS